MKKLALRSTVLFALLFALGGAVAAHGTPEQGSVVAPTNACGEGDKTDADPQDAANDTSGPDEELAQTGEDMEAGEKAAANDENCEDQTGDQGATGTSGDKSDDTPGYKEGEVEDNTS